MNLRADRKFWKCKNGSKTCTEYAQMKTARPLDLNDLPHFVEAAESGSFSAAARVLGIPPSLMSRKIARLEEAVGARLFQRTTRSLALTDAGRGFLDHARAALAAVESARQSLGDSAGSLAGRVRLSAPYGAATALWSVLSTFLRKHPEMRIDLLLADRFVDLVEERFDLAIRSSGANRMGTLIGRQLSAAPRCFFASPKYLEVHGRPRSVSDLKNHACVIQGPSADRTIWRVQVGGRKQNVVVQGRIAVNESLVAADCVADGFGIGFLPMAVCGKHLDAGTLVRILPRAAAAQAGLWMVYPDRHLPVATRALVDHLAEELPKVINTLLRP